MKVEGVIIFFCLFFIVMGNFAVSASGFSDFFNGITGKVVSDCTDSDVTTDYPNGKNPYTKGIASSSGNSKEDYCIDENRNTYYEAYCSFVGPAFAALTCPTGTCVDGACVSCTPSCTGKVCGDDGCGGSCGGCAGGETCIDGQCRGELTCSDTDVSIEYPDGRNLFVEGTASLSDGSQSKEDSCGVNAETVNEAYCSNGLPVSSVLFCPTGYYCSNAICVQQQTCSDSDNGLNYNTAGSCASNSVNLNDECVVGGDNNGKLKESYCLSDSCNSVFYSCQYGCENGKCKSCTPSCTGKVCGDDGCGGICGSCSSGKFCVSGQCTSECTPSCTGKVCGDDGCGGSCGTCKNTDACVSGNCIADCIDSDKTTEYPDGKNLYVKGKTTRLSTGKEEQDYCDSKYYGILQESVCIGYFQKYESSGCKNGCVDGACILCTAKTCSELGKQCGSWNNECGNQINCGNCTGGEACTEGICVSCTPSCTGKVCGDDGCGGSCGSCAGGESCSGGACIKINNEKEMSKYSNKEVFLISDNNWKEVLPLAPLTTWTSQEGVGENCKKGYGTPDKVCVYPTLIYHSESGQTINVNDFSFNFDVLPNEAMQAILNGELDGNMSLSSNTVSPGETLIMAITFNNIGSRDIYIGSLVMNHHPVQLTTSSEEIIVDKTLSPGQTDVININFDYPIDNSKVTFDIDSSIYFMQQYSADKVTIIGQTPQDLDDVLIAAPDFGAGLSQSQIKRISAEDYFSYWKNYGQMVYVEDNYELALIASTYASLINSPLVIKGTSSDTENIFSGKNVICVGSVSPAGTSCSEQYDLASLQEKYAQETNTDKIVLVNPNDLNIKVEEEFKPSKSNDPVYYLYSKNSLISPILAAAKHEILITSSSSNYQEVDGIINNKISELGLNPDYLTILASPNAIDMSFIDFNPRCNANGCEWSTDSWYYSRLDSDRFLDLATGRIYGITDSDSASNVARSLFYEETLKNPNKILVTTGEPYINTAAEVYALGKLFEVIGYDVKTYTQMETDNDKYSFIIYRDHGSPKWAGDWGGSNLDNSFVEASACLTCKFNVINMNKQESKCARVMRGGAIGYIGSVEAGGYFNTAALVSEIFTRESSIGKAFLKSQNSYDALFGSYWTVPYPEYVLLGDPTLKLKVLHKIPDINLELASQERDISNYKLTMPALKVIIPDEVKNLCEDPSYLTDYYFIPGFRPDIATRGLLRKFEFNLGDYGINNPISVSGSGSWSLVKNPNGKENWILSPGGIDSEPYFIDASEQEFTKYEFDIAVTTGGTG